MKIAGKIQNQNLSWLCQFNFIQLQNSLIRHIWIRSIQQVPNYHYRHTVSNLHSIGLSRVHKERNPNSNNKASKTLLRLNQTTTPRELVHSKNRCTLMLLSPKCNKAITSFICPFKTKIKMSQLAISMAPLRAWPCETKAKNNLACKNMEEMTILKQPKLYKDKTQLSLALPRFWICISQIT